MNEYIVFITNTKRFRFSGMIGTFNKLGKLSKLRNLGNRRTRRVYILLF